MAVFTMPSLGADMEQGKLVEWLVAPGDTVQRGDVVAVVETQKGAIEIEVFDDGVVRRLDAQPGDTLPVGAPLAVIGQGDADEAAPAAETPAAAPEATVASAETTTPDQPAAAAPAPPPPGPPPGAGPAASPAARAAAAERGVDLAGVSGSGPGGAVVLADVDRAGAAPAPGGLPAETGKPGKPGLDLDAMRDAIAAAMARSNREIPHYYLDHEVDLQAAQDWLSARNARHGPAERILMGALFVKATARAAVTAKGINGRYDDGFRPSDTVNAGVAVALRGGGLIAPAIMGAETLDLPALMEAMRDLVGRARAGRLKGSEMTEGTITVSSLGESGVDGMTGVIYPPQVALVAFGTPRAQPRVIDGRVAPRHCVRVSLAADHRVSDGRRGAKFLVEIDRLLQAPEAL